ncbi:Uu.00g050720.m01.CDS01 [Anthostomella pinea]|uniref:Uu.00g050720.m01.CDS01 n=1 Tax=Anthostomella pinea TaxID=933095 RepID=A0AAI8YMP7_9PEZI|nr:Uu.00g050720.m01.CDS01 [Anthostomella pinea]
MALTGGNASHKGEVRDKVWKELRKVAYPDSRFHFDFSSFIADFEDSQKAANRLLSLASYRECSTVFITPDNCLEYLREQTLQAGTKVLMTTYGIRRGFWLLDPATIDETLYKYASTLDGMEKIGRHVSLADIVQLKLDVGFMVTGTGAINHRGIRFGKGHGFFDLEWGLLFSTAVVRGDTMTAALVHECQVLDEELRPEEFDTICDLVITPTRVLEAGAVEKPTCGILWDRLEVGMLEDIPPLQELRTMKVAGSTGI